MHTMTASNVLFRFMAAEALVGSPDSNCRAMAQLDADSGGCRPLSGRVLRTGVGAMGTLTRLPPSSLLASAVAIIVFVFAFLAAPSSCDWGLSAYLWVGVVAVLAVGALPFFHPVKMPTVSVGLQSVLYVAAISLTWIAGLFLANVRIVCRLI